MNKNTNVNITEAERKRVVQLQTDNVKLKKLFQQHQMMIKKLENDNRKLKREKAELTLKVNALTKQMKAE